MVNCPTYIGQLPDVSGYGLAFGKTGRAIYAPRTSSGGTVARDTIGKYTYPGLDLLLEKTPVLSGSKFLQLAPVFILSPYANGGTGSTGDGVNDGDIVFVSIDASNRCEMWWTPGGAGATYRIGWFLDNDIVNIAKINEDTIWGFTQTPATHPTNTWRFFTMPIPQDAAQASAWSTAQTAAGMTAIPLVATQVESGTHASSQIRWQDPVATPDGAVWLEYGNQSTRHDLWRWHASGGAAPRVELAPNGSGGFIGIPAFEMPASIPRPDSSVWTILEDSFTPGHTDGISVTPEGVIGDAPCLDTFINPIDGLTLDNVRMTGVAASDNAGQVAVNLINAQLGHIWRLDEAVGAPWLRQRQRDDIERVRHGAVGNQPTSRQRSIRQGVRNTYW